MSLQSYREWKNEKLVEFDVAGSNTQGKQALKVMNPRITAFASNLANLLSEIENETPGYAKQLITRMMSKLDEPNPILKNKLLQTLRYLPEPTPQPQQNA